ncbi:MAG: TonB-dependent receptor plug domain-containing protein [Desulfobacterales bacterium]
MSYGKGVMVTILAITVWVSVACPLEAEDAVNGDACIQEIEDLNIVATPIIQGNILDRYAGQKTTVTEEQIENLNAMDISTALRKTPGVNISRYNPIGSFGGGEGGAVFIRGLGSSRPGAEIKTFIDGVPMYMSVWNHPLLDLLAIDPAAAIDVYKSPQPQHFGNALAAINIVPKRRIDRGYRTKIKLAAGSYDTYVTTAETDGRIDRFDYYAGGAYRVSDGHRDHAEGRMQNVFGRFGYRLNDYWDASFFGLYSDNYAEDPGVKGTVPAVNEGTYETRAFLSSLTISHDHDTVRGSIKLYRNAGEGDWLDQPTETTGVFEDLLNDFEYYGIKIRESLVFGTGGQITGGIDWDYTEGDYKKFFSDGTTDHWQGNDFTTVSPHAAVSWKIAFENGFYLLPSLGVRYYEHTDFDQESSPHAGLIMGYGALQGHLGYARGVVYPGLDVVVLSEEVITALGDSWKELEPEIMDHYEAGVSYDFGRTAVADLTFFYNDGRDRYVIIPPPPVPPVFENVEDYVTKGVEMSFQVCPTADLALFFSGSFIDADPSDLPYAPDKTFSGGLNWHFLQPCTLNVDVQYVDDMRVASQARRTGAVNDQSVDDYLIINGKLSYAFSIQNGFVTGEFFVAGENLSDADYEYRPGYPMAGINGMAGISLIF